MPHTIVDDVSRTGDVKNEMLTCRYWSVKINDVGFFINNDFSALLYNYVYTDLYYNTYDK